MTRGDVDSLYPAALSPQTGADIRIRHAYGGNSRAIDYSARYGLLRDDSRLAERIEGPARRAPNATFGALPSATYKVGMSISGGGTPSDPGGYNWGTFGNVLSGATKGIGQAATYVMQSRAKSRQRNAQVPGNGTVSALPAPKAMPSPKAPATSGTAAQTAAPFSNYPNPKDPIEAANKGLQAMQRSSMMSSYPNPKDPIEAVNKGIGDMLRAQQATIEARRLSPSDLYKTNKSLRAAFPNFYNNK